MLLQFPNGFLWGTSTAAAQVETAGDHVWRGVRARDGYVFERTTDHELRRMEDAEFIARFGSLYRCGVDWARLQSAPFAEFEPAVVEEYRAFFQTLRDDGVELVFVIHHFCHPNWFEQAGGWTRADNIPMFVDFARQCIEHFGEYVRWWNTFNEPNVYALNAFLLGNFPPFKKGRYRTANRVLDNMGRAHEIVRARIREKYDAPVGISLNTGFFKGTNSLGAVVAAFFRWWFMRRAARPFEQCDFWGLSYYAYMLFDPFPIDAQTRAPELERRGIPHDKMWGYYPEGLGHVLLDFHRRYNKPIAIMENGICTESDAVRIQSLRDYLSVCHRALREGINLWGYIHWSTWDNFEWNLGPTYRFGLVRVNFDTMERRMTAAGEFYEQIVRENAVEV